MIVEIEKYIGTLIKLKITPSQFLFCYLTHQRLYSDLYRWTMEGQAFTTQELLDLEDKGLIINLNTGTQTFPDSYVVDDQFVNLVFHEDKTRTGMEFWDAYPPYIMIDGKKFPGRNIDQESFLRDYYLKIGHSPHKHEKVLVALEYAKRNALITQGLKNWFGSHQWETIQQTMEKDAKPTVFPGERII